MEECIKEELPTTTELEEGLRNGVILAKMGHFMAPSVVPLRLLILASFRILIYILSEGGFLTLINRAGAGVDFILSTRTTLSTS